MNEDIKLYLEKENGQRINLADLLSSIFDPTAQALKTTAKLEAQSVEVTVGAVELKDGETEARAVVNSNGLTVDVQNIKAGTNLIGKVGIDQLTPNANAVVLKTSPKEQVPTNITEIECSVALTIAAGGLYVANDIINNGTDNTLPALDFSTAFGSSLANRKIQINSIQVRSSKGGATTKLVPEVILYNANTLTGQTLTDSAPFNPTEAQHTLKKATGFSKNENWYLADFAYGNFYEMRLTEIMRNVTLDSAGKAYPALIATNGYTSDTNEVITITVKAYLLN